MASLIKFYIPPSFHKLVKWIPPAGRGKVLEFPAEIRKSAWQMLKTSIPRCSHSIVVSRSI